MLLLTANQQRRALQVAMDVCDGRHASHTELHICKIDVKHVTLLTSMHVPIFTGPYALLCMNANCSGPGLINLRVVAARSLYALVLSATEQPHTGSEWLLQSKRISCNALSLSSHMLAF